MLNKLSEYQIGLAMARVNEGANFRQVGREFGVSKDTIWRLRHRIDSKGSPNRKSYLPKKKSGLPEMRGR